LGGSSTYNSQSTGISTPPCPDSSTVGQFTFMLTRRETYEGEGAVEG